MNLRLNRSTDHRRDLLKISGAGIAGLAALILFCSTATGQTAVTLQPPNLTGAIGGTLAGESGVSSSGAATYSVQIAMPPGTSGVVPSISLDYSSQFGMASMGQGWRIDGMSQITRCPKTIVQDGVRRGVALTAEDQFCLDNQRLLMVPSSGTHGATAEYRLQVDAQSKVQSFGSDPAKGPDYWEIRNRNGLIFTYGKTADATIEAQGTSKPVLTWALSRVMDRRGNYYDIRYTEVNTSQKGEFYPDRILYTGHIDQSGNAAGNRSPYNAVEFVYEDRPDLQLGFVAGSRITNSKRLTAVRTRTLTDADGNAGSLVRDYRIAYTVNPTNGRSLVDTISDCNGAGSCFPATHFKWSVRDTGANTFNASGGGNWGGPQTTLTPLSAGDGDESAQVRNQVVTGDFNGDGLLDLMRGDGAGNWQVCLSQSTGFNCQNWAGPAVLTREALTGDFNGDGKTDLAVYPKVDGPGTWTVCLSTGTGFDCKPWAGYGATYVYAQGEVTGALVGDFNGDGRDDVALSGWNSGSELICKSTGSGFEGGCQTYPGSFPFIYYAQLATDEFLEGFAQTQMSGDIDGDGRTDVVHLQGYRRKSTTYPAGVWAGLRPTDTGFQTFSAQSTGQVMLDGVVSPGSTKFTDVTADSYAALSDVVNGYVSDGQGGVDRMELCRGSGAGMTKCIALPKTNWVSPLVATVTDIDGDGRPDVLMSDGRVCQLALTAYGDANADQYNLDCTLWTWASLPPSLLMVYRGDFNGDGRPDLAAYVKTSSSTGYWSISLAGHGGFQDLLDTVTNGLGQQVRYIYKRAEDPAVYTRGPDLPYPKASQRGSGAVVATMQTGNGVGGWLSTDYQYEANRTDLSGRGSLGYEKRRVIDRIKNITTQTTVSQSFPTIGRPIEIRATQANGVVLNLQTTTFDSIATTAAAVCPYAKTVSQQAKDLTGTLVSTTTTAVNANGIDAYCNPTSVTTSVSTADGASFSTTTTNAYDNRLASWLIGLVTNSTVSTTAIQPYANASPPSLALAQCATSAASLAAGTMICTLSNSGQTAASSVAYSSNAGTTVAGPSSCTAGTDNCGLVTVTSAATAGSYSGTVTATPTPSGGSGSSTYTIVVNSAPKLTLTSCSTSAASLSAATMSCTLGNSGQTSASSIVYGAGSGATATGPTTCAAGNANCGTVMVTSSATAGTYAGSVTATPTPAGTVASASYTLTVNTPPALTLTSCGTTAASTSAAKMNCTLGNSGQTAASSIGYAAGSGTTATGPSTCAGGTANCGTVTVTSSATAGTYTGSVTATPTPTGSVASAGYTLVVNTSPALTLTGCNTSAASMSAATMNCTLGNSGQTSASGISYGAGSGATATGPSTCAAGSSNCGTVTVTSSSSAGTYTGSLTATPNPAGGAASAAYTLTVYTAPVLTLTNCTSSATSTAAATFSCTLGNGGQASTGVGYAGGSGTSVSGPGSCSGNNSNCGTVVLTTSTTPGAYAGTLSASPTAGGSGAGASYSLRVWSTSTTLSVSPTILDWGTVTGGGSQKSVTIQNTGLAPTSLNWGVSYTSGSIGMGGYSTTGAQTTCVSGQTLDLGASCTIAVTFTSQCTAHGARNGLLNVSGNAASTVSATLAANSQKATLCN